MTELISSQLCQFNAIFAASMQTSFDNIRAFIDERFASQDIQPETNPSFADSSPVPVDLGPRQTQTDPSVRSPCVDFGSGGEAQEPVQADLATSSFLASLRAAGIVVPQGVVIGDRVDRAPSANVHGVPAVAAQHEQPQEPLGGGRTALAASAHSAPTVKGGQAQSILRSGRASSSQAGLAGPSLGTSPHEATFLGVTFAESEHEFAEEDAASYSSEKAEVSEGHRNVLRLLYQLCPGAAPKSPPAQRRVCDFEGLFTSADPTPALEGAPTLFHRVAELREEHQTLFRAAAEAGKAVASALPSRRRDRGCCSHPLVASSAPMNPAIPRLVGALSNRQLLSFSFEEASRVESLCMGRWRLNRRGFGIFRPSYTG